MKLDKWWIIIFTKFYDTVQKKDFENIISYIKSILKAILNVSGNQVVELEFTLINLF